MLGDRRPYSQDQIQIMVNAWVEQEFSVKAEINVDSMLQQLQDLRAPLFNGEGKFLIEKLSDSRLQACEIESAKYILDYKWDHAFRYANPRTN